MKKAFGLIIVIVFFYCACGHKEPIIEIIPDIQKNHLQRNHLFGPIKEMRTEQYIMANTTDTLSEGKLISTTIQRYSADGFLTGVITLNQNRDTLFLEKINYSNDAKVLSHRKLNENKNIIAESFYQYDRNGFKIGEKHTDQGVCYLTILYKNDDQGNAIEMTQKRDSVTLKNRFHYNSHGLVSQIEEYDPSGKIFKYITYEYDNYGDEVNRRVYDKNNKQLEFTYKVYTQEGHLLRVLYEDLIHNIKTVSEYTKRDAKGNWTKGEYKKQNQTIYTQKRTIHYY